MCKITQCVKNYTLCVKLHVVSKVLVVGKTPKFSKLGHWRILRKLGPGWPSAGGPRMDRRVVTSPGVVKVSRLASRLWRSARRGAQFFNQRVIPGSLWVTSHFWIRGSFLRAGRRRREVRREIFTTPGQVTTRRSILGPPAEGRPGPSLYKITHRKYIFAYQYG